MKSTLDFGHVFVEGNKDALNLVQQMQKFIQVNGDVVLEESAYKNCVDGYKRKKLLVTVELVEA